MKPLVDKHYLLHKYQGKGGWTYAVIAGVPRGKGATVRVMGTIDGFDISKFHLFSMGDGNMMMPVKAEIRKKIKKEAGDKVHIILYPDNEPLEIPGEFRLCLQDEPKAAAFFYKLSESEQKYYVQWIYGAKKEETRYNRIATAINRLADGLKRYDQG